MSQPVLGLGAALVTASGCVWYLPALAEVRAGADRPDSLRSSAAACLSGWTTIAGIAVLLLIAETWWPPGTLAAAGAAVTAALWIRAAVQRRREAREAVHDWAELSRGPLRVGAHGFRNLFVALVGAGLAASAASAVFLVAVGRVWVAVVVGAGVMGLFLAVAIGCGCVARREERVG
ncbi:hypothetical protein [Streptomyces sp. HUAS ZL42]|uniref:hypothetical protein n=1 Tax=Streptomyces sp. HUAS ZL42 TaxID=3231715 RepID=UPI00345EFAF0